MSFYSYLYVRKNRVYDSDKLLHELLLENVFRNSCLLLQASRQDVADTRNFVQKQHQQEQTYRKRFA